jgi:hypothetical protein
MANLESQCLSDIPNTGGSGHFTPKPACAGRKNALRLGTLPARGGPGQVTASGRRRAATGWSRRIAAAGRPPRILTTRIFRASVTACSGGFRRETARPACEVRLPVWVCCRRCGANPCGGGRGGAPDRARSLRGACEVTDLAAFGPRQASQRGPAPEPGFAPQ